MPSKTLGALVDQPADAEEAPGLLVRRRHEDHVAGQRGARPMEGDECRQVDDAGGLRIECTPAVHHLVTDLARQRVGDPRVRIGRHDVDVVKQEQARLFAPLETRPDIASAPGPIQPSRTQSPRLRRSPQENPRRRFRCPED